LRFQNKLLFTYTLLILLLTVVLSILFYGYSADVFERNALDTYELLGAKLGQQLDNVMRPMDFISTNLISDAGFKTSLASLDSLDRTNPRNSYITTEAELRIRSLLYSYSIVKNFYAVVVFNRRGDFFSSNFMDHREVSSANSVASKPVWIGPAITAEGRSVSVAPYEDRWRTEGRAVVFGRARSVPGLKGELGFIEVQNRVEGLESIMEVPGQEFVRILIFQASGDVFYLSEDIAPDLIEYYRSRGASDLGASAQGTGFRRNPLTGQEEAIVATTSDYSGLTVALVLNKRILLSPLRFIRFLTLGLGVLIIFFSVAYTWFSSKQLTKPLKLIQGRMEMTGLSNLPQGVPLEHPNDEIVALDLSFRNLTARLDEAITRELGSRTRWMQARLDSLQAQVNPHFINNILTVIANRGLESGDERIGEICDGVASMLRYSTSTEERSADVEQELEHVGTYLFLMKQRLEDKLSYRVEAESAVRKAVMPKMVLQQIVENSINHGYRRIPKPITIGIRGYASDGRWIMELTDDGEGFDPARLAGLEERIRTAERSLRAGTEGTGMGIGGLGLLNTWSRLFLFYRGDFLWRIENRDSGGVKVTLGGPLEYDAGEVRDAVGADRRG